MFKSSRSSESLDEKNATILEKDAVFEGKLTFEGTVEIWGQFRGEIFSTGHLIIGETATVEGRIEVNVLQVAGIVKGLLNIKDRLELLAKAQVLADVSTNALIVEHGAKFQGQCQMGVAPLKSDSRKEIPSVYSAVMRGDSDRVTPSVGGMVGAMDEIELFQ